MTPARAARNGFKAFICCWKIKSLPKNIFGLAKFVIDAALKDAITAATQATKNNTFDG
jgi:hypothetical protein